jgi:MoaA/NifB/PqqE/SkfB family radical SAM enzyme
LSLIREADPALTFCLSTNGLMLPHCISELAALGVTHLTITINAVNPAVGARIYKYADYLGQRYEGEAAAGILMANQLSGLKLAADLGLAVKVNTVLLKGINDAHIEEVVERVAALGAHMSNIMQLIPVRGSAFGEMPLISRVEHQILRRQCGRHLKQMHHCRQCRADAVGLLDHDQSLSYHRRRPEPGPPPEAGNQEAQPLKIAVVSKSGVLVDQHFGQADHFYIYESNGQDVRLLETRPVSSGGGGERCGRGGGPALQKPEGLIAKLLETIDDCDGVVVMRIGETPKNHLTKRGIAVISTYETIDKAVREAAVSLGH